MVISIFNVDELINDAVFKMHCVLWVSFYVHYMSYMCCNYEGYDVLILSILQDTTCIGGLVLVLSNPDESIVKLALEVIYCLACDSDDLI